MRLAFLVNEVATEIDEYATTRLARAAAQDGHEVWHVGIGDVELGPADRELTARARAVGLERGDTLATFMERIKAREPTRIGLDDLDALFLRNDSIEDLQERPWASPLGVVFGQMLAGRGVTVVNDPTSLKRATSKMYLEEFPQEIRPRSLVTRDPDAIERFVGDVGHCVIKPVYGAKGRNVFMVADESETNLAQMIEAVLDDGYALGPGVRRRRGGRRRPDLRARRRDPRVRREARRLPPDPHRARPPGQHQHGRTLRPLRGG